MTKFKPMLAVEADLSKVEYPAYISPKLDGIRVIIKEGVALSRSLKPIRNEHVQKLFGKPEYDGLDGELMVGNPCSPDVFTKTTSAVMSKDGEPDVVFRVFDYYQSDEGYKHRYDILREKCNGLDVIPVQAVLVHSEAELLDMYNEYVSLGYEGAMVRHTERPYKFGRSTVNSQHLLKLKPFDDAEFVVVGFTEQMQNMNEATVNKLGYTERSSSKEGKVGKDTLGALVLRLESDSDTTFECGTGFSDLVRKTIWENQEMYLGKLAKIQYQGFGSKGLPRFPSFLGWRDENDI